MKNRQKIKIAFLAAAIGTLAHANPIQALYVFATQPGGASFIYQAPGLVSPGTTVSAADLSSCTSFSVDFACAGVQFNAGGQLVVSFTGPEITGTATFSFPANSFSTVGGYDIGPPNAHLAVLLAPVYYETSYLYEWNWPAGGRSFSYLSPGIPPPGTVVNAADLATCVNPSGACVNVQFLPPGTFGLAGDVLGITSEFEDSVGTSYVNFPIGAFSNPGLYNSQLVSGQTLRVTAIPASPVPEPGTGTFLSLAGAAVVVWRVFQRRADRWSV